MKKQVVDTRVLQHTEVNAQCFILDVEVPCALKDIKGGQFANLRVDDSQHTYLRRPVSIHDADETKNTLSFFIKEVGEGTSHLRRLQAGDMLNVVFPLGNGFGQNDTQKPLLIGGGCGIAPLYLLSKQLLAKGIKPVVLVGGREAADILWTEKFTAVADLLICTEDGSVGTKGFVTNHEVMSRLNEFDKLMVCGPGVMMKAIAALAEEQHILCEVSLENTMACGVGACLCCVTNTDEGHKCVCTDGPVFDSRKLR